MKNLILILVVIFIASCAPSRFVKPLQKGEQALGCSLGGAMIHYGGASIPIPNTSFFYGKGITDQLTVHGSVYGTSLAYGVIQLDGGAVYRFVGSDSSQWGMSANMSFNLAIDRYDWKAKLWPNLEWNSYYHLGKRGDFIYGGLGYWFELSGMRAHDQKQDKQVMLYPQLGYSFKKKNWSLETELRWLAPGRMNLPNAVSYVGIQEHGAVGLYFQFIRRF